MKLKLIEKNRISYKKLPIYTDTHGNMKYMPATILIRYHHATNDPRLRRTEAQTNEANSRSKLTVGTSFTCELTEGSSKSVVPLYRLDRTIDGGYRAPAEAPLAMYTSAPGTATGLSITRTTRYKVQGTEYRVLPSTYFAGTARPLRTGLQ